MIGYLNTDYYPMLQTTQAEAEREAIHRIRVIAVRRTLNQLDRLSQVLHNDEMRLLRDRAQRSGLDKDLLDLKPPFWF